MRQRRGRILRSIATMAVAVLLLGACGGGDDDTAGGGTADEAGAGARSVLAGLFGLTAGECTDGAVTAGSYFRMVQSNGTVADGPFVVNNDSACGDKTYTPLHPGSDGGLKAGEFQPSPDPAFDGNGNGTASSITQPTKFFAVDFATATNQTDPQTGTNVEAPSITNDGGKLSGSLAAFAAAWSGQHFNQGSPKPDGSTPGNTSAVTGTYNEETGAYTLEWASQIVGGPFNNFTGVWHFEGTYKAA